MIIPSWLTHALIAMFFWGFWGFFGKLAERSMSAQNLTIFSLFGWLITLPIIMVIFWGHFKTELGDVNYWYAVLSGVLGSFGGVFFFFALEKGDVSQAVAVTALYPLVAVLLAHFFLHEPITIQRAAGIVFALAGIYLLSK